MTPMTVRVLIEDDGAAKNRGIGAEVPPPQAIAQEDNPGRIVTVVGGAEERPMAGCTPRIGSRSLVKAAPSSRSGSPGCHRDSGRWALGPAAILAKDVAHALPITVIGGGGLDARIATGGVIFPDFDEGKRDRRRGAGGAGRDRRG